MIYLFLSAACLAVAFLGGSALAWDIWRRAILMERERMTFLASYEQLWKSQVKAMQDMDSAWNARFSRLEAGRLGEAFTKRPG